MERKRAAASFPVMAEKQALGKRTKNSGVLSDQEFGREAIKEMLLDRGRKKSSKLT